MLGALAVVTLRDNVQICTNKKYRVLVYDTFSRKMVDITNVADLNGLPAPPIPIDAATLKECLSCLEAEIAIWTQEKGCFLLYLLHLISL